MTTAEAKKWLQQAFTKYRSIQLLQDRIIHAESMARQTTSNVQALRVSGTSERSKLETYICRALDYRSQLADEMDELVQLKAQATEVISQLADPRHRDVLKLRHADFLSWYEIAREMKYSESMVRWVLYQAALKEFAKIIDETQKISVH